MVLQIYIFCLKEINQRFFFIYADISFNKKFWNSEGDNSNILYLCVRLYNRINLVINNKDVKTCR